MRRGVWIVAALLTGAACAEGGPAGLPFDCTVEIVETNADYVVERFVYPSPVPPSFPEAKNVIAYCFRPVGLPPGRRPAVLCLHILGGNGSITRAIASSYAARGMTALMPLMPMFLERTPACGRLTDLASPNGPRHLGETFRAVPHDIRRSLDVLAALPDVNSQRIGLIGTSLGGILGVSAATDPRVQKAVFLLAGGDLESILQANNHEVQPIAACVARANASERAVLDEAMRTLEPLRAMPALAEKVKAGRIRMFNAADDEVVPPANTRRLAEALGLAGGRNFTLIPGVGHYTAILKLPDIVDETAEFFGGADLKPRPPRPNRSDDATVKGVFAQLNKLVSGNPQTGRVHRVGVKVDVVRDGAVAFAGFASFLCGPGGRFAVSVDDVGFKGVGAIRLGRGERLWVESAKGTAFCGSAASRANFIDGLDAKARRVYSAAILLTALVAQSGNLALFEKFVKISLQTRGDSRAIVIGDGAFTAEVTLDSTRNVPTGVFYKKGGTEVRVVFTEWNLEAPYRAADFEPRAGAPRREVDAATLDAVISALLGFALEGGFVK